MALLARSLAQLAALVPYLVGELVLELPLRCLHGVAAALELLKLVLVLLLALVHFVLGRGQHVGLTDSFMEYEWFNSHRKADGRHEGQFGAVKVAYDEYIL